MTNLLSRFIQSAHKEKKSRLLTPDGWKEIAFKPGGSHHRSTVEIEIMNKPTIRLIRNVTFTRLDFIVSIGGIIGLFFGASILSLAEIIYVWTIRKF